MRTGRTVAAASARLFTRGGKHGSAVIFLRNLAACGAFNLVVIILYHLFKNLAALGAFVFK